MSFSTSATLTLKNDDDFHRVLEFVKPDESDTEPQTDEEYRQVMDFLHNLQKSELCAWMTKHCTRLYVNFRANPEEKVLSWSGRNIQGGLACDIAELVVAQFPDIVFRICTAVDGVDDLEFGISDQGKVRWLELSDDINDMFEWGIDVDPYAGPTPENYEELRQYRRARVQEMIDLGINISIDTWPPTDEQFEDERRRRRVQEMIDLGVNISIDTWPPTEEQFEEEHRLRCVKNNESETLDNGEGDHPDLPF